MNDNLVERNEKGTWKPFFQFRDSIVALIELPQESLAVLTMKKTATSEPHIVRNVWRLDRNGKTQWQIEESMAPIEQYVVLRTENGKLFAHTQGGYVYEVDLNTGKVTYSGFTK